MTIIFVLSVVMHNMKILVSPLDWGLGHATRLVPIIRKRLAEGCEVVIAGSGLSLRLLRMEFPELECATLKSFSPRFSSHVPQWLMIMLQTPLFLLYILYERWQTASIVRRYNIEEIISDNRYGVRSSYCKSSIITHQLSPLPWRGSSVFVNTIISRIIGQWISQFDECWIPDDEACLSGRLSVSKFVRSNIIYIGMQSRLSAVDIRERDDVDVLAMISGPEPQRSDFERQILTVAAASERRFLLVNGTMSETRVQRGNVTIIGSATAEEMASYIKSARTIICRSGYSSLMDLMVLGRRAILVPTPGQAEQEYLAERCKAMGFDSVEQRNFVLFCEKKLRDL